MIDHWSFISGRTLQDYQDLPAAEPFSQEFWLLNETEHGSDAPDRLHGFDLIRTHGARTPELDRDLLVPFFLRYLWEVPYPNYTREAWRLLKTLVSDTEDLAEAARAIVSSHPQGTLRAQVLAWRRDYDVPDYLQSATFEPLLTQLARNDPAPDVRAEALRLITLRSWDYSYRESAAGQTAVALLLAVLRDDPAPNVRAVAFELLADPATSGQTEGAIEQQLMSALQRPDNLSVFAALMARFGRHCLSGLRVSPHRLAAALNALAPYQAHPLFSDMLQPFGWFILGSGQPTGPLSRRWLQATPFADGDVLLAFAKTQFCNQSADMPERALALVTLDKCGQPVSRQAFVDFLLDPAQTHEAHEICTKAYALMRALFVRPVDQAQTPHELLALLVAHSRSRPSVDCRDAAAVGGPFRQALCDQALSQVLRGPELIDQDLRDAFELPPPPVAQALFDAVLHTVQTDPTDISFALYELGIKPTNLDLSKVLDIVRLADHPTVGRTTAARLAQRYANLRDEATLALIEAVLSWTQKRDLLVDLVDELPSLAALTAQPDHRARLVAAVRAAHGRVPVGDTEYDVWVARKTDAWLAATA